MAFQTSTDATSTETVSVSATAGSSANGSDDTNNNFGNQGTTPLIPALLLAGFLLTGIVILCLWRRRVISTPTMFSGSEGGGGRYMIGPRMGLARMYGVSGPWEYIGMYDIDRAARQVSDLGPKPKIWDAYLNKCQLLNDDAGTGVKWKDIQPLTVALLEDESNHADHVQPLGLVSEPSKGTSQTLPWQKEPKGSKDMLIEHASPKKGQVYITIVVSMPVPSNSESTRGSSPPEYQLARRRSLRCTSADASGSSHLNDHDLMIGTSITSCDL